MAAKLKDGLFIGDADTSFSEDFINENKISNLVNLSGREVGRWLGGLVFDSQNAAASTAKYCLLATSTVTSYFSMHGCVVVVYAVTFSSYLMY